MSAAAPAVSRIGAPQPASAAQGVGLVVLAVTLFAASDILAKHVGARASALQVGWLRYAAFAAVALILAARGGFSALRSQRPTLQLARGVAVLGSGLLFILGLHRLGVAEATAVSFVAPAFITALSILFLKEAVGVRRWIAVGLGLVGVAMVVRPGGQAFQPAALFSLSSALCGAIGVVLTRRIGDADGATTTLLWSALIGVLGLTLSAPLWIGPMSAGELATGAVMGALYGLGQYMLIHAYSRGEVSLLAPFSYAQLIAAAVLGYLVFRHLPDSFALAGMAVIMLSGGYTLHRERVRRRRIAWRLP